jgi:glycosyltransferase involved in cell wall biosynthesis
MNPPLFIHIPTPGDHYSPATGSATMTVIHELARRHAAAGGETRVIVNAGTHHDYAVGQCVEVRGPAYPPDWKRGMDRILSHLGMSRPLSAAIYRPYILAVPEEFAGPLFIHNAPSAIRPARRLRPNATICLWAHNKLFRTYSDREMRDVVAAADRVFCCSRFIADSLIPRLPRDLAGRVRVVHNGVDAEQFHPAATPPGNDSPMIVFVGRVQPVKGADLLVRAAIKLAAQGISFRLRIVGSQNFSSIDPLSPYERDLREIAKPIATRVEFIPFVNRDEIRLIYQAADLHVVPSNWDEPFGLTVLEGLACGLPSIVSRRGGIPEAAGDAALYFDPPDVDQLADQLGKFLSERRLRQDWSRRARARALEMTWEHSYGQLLTGLKPDRPRPPASAAAPRTLIHIPTPGDHYSTATGSATISVVHELTRRHLAHGAQVRIIVGRGTRHDLPDGQCCEADFSYQRGLAHRFFDLGLGWAGLPRRSARLCYAPALEVIEPDFDGTILIYNGPGVVDLFKEHRPRAQVCLYAVNALFRSFSRAEVRRVVDQAHRVICCSQFIADDLLRHLGRTSNKVKVVHNGVDSKHFVPPAAEPGRDRLKILFIGRATANKGPDLLLKAAGLIHGKAPPFTVRIVGSHGFAATTNLDPYERLLRDLAEPIRDSVEFQPSISRTQLSQEYHAADLFCAPSNWDDPFPLTVLEAQACGLPVVASRRGGIPERAEDSILFFNPPNVEELAERLAFFLQNPQERKIWGARGRARAEMLDWNNQYNVLRQALEEQ